MMPLRWLNSSTTSGHDQPRPLPSQSARWIRSVSATTVGYMIHVGMFGTRKMYISRIRWSRPQLNTPQTWVSTVWFVCGLDVLVYIRQNIHKYAMMCHTDRYHLTALWVWIWMHVPDGRELLQSIPSGVRWPRTRRIHTVLESVSTFSHLHIFSLLEQTWPSWLAALTKKGLYNN